MRAEEKLLRNKVNELEKAKGQLTEELDLKQRTIHQFKRVPQNILILVTLWRGVNDDRRKMALGVQSVFACESPSEDSQCFACQDSEGPERSTQRQSEFNVGYYYVYLGLLPATEHRQF